MKRVYERGTEKDHGDDRIWYFFRTEMDVLREGTHDVMQWIAENWHGELYGEWDYHLLQNLYQGWYYEEDGWQNDDDPQHSHFVFEVRTTNEQDAVAFALTFCEG